MKYPGFHTFKEAAYARMKAYQYRCNMKGIPFELTEDQFYTLITSPCHYSGQPPQKMVKTWAGIFYHGGIDRKDNTQGYTLENSLPCCEFANYGKREKSYESFVAWLEQVAKFRTNPNEPDEDDPFA